MKNMVTAIIQARMGSSRLRGKVLMSRAGQPLLAWVLESVRKLTFVQTIIVATTFLAEDDVIADFCHAHQIECFRGDPVNVLSRFVAIAASLPPDGQVIRVTADNPLNWPEKCSHLYDLHLSACNDYTAVSGLSHLVCEVMQVSALSRIAKETDLSDYDCEHVTSYFRKHQNKFNVQEVAPTELGISPDLDQLLTVDTDADYQRFKRLVADLNVRVETDFNRILTWVSSDAYRY